MKPRPGIPLRRRPPRAYAVALALSVCLLLAGSWGAFHRAAHAVPARVASALGPSSAGQGGSLSAPYDHAEQASRGSALAGHHQAGSDECRWLDQLALADGLWADAPPAAAVPPATPVPVVWAVLRAQAPTHGWQARAPPRGFRA